MEIKFNLNLKAFSEDKLYELLRQGVLTRFEVLDELRTREEEKILSQRELEEEAHRCGIDL